MVQLCEMSSVSMLGRRWELLSRCSGICSLGPPFG